MSDHAPVLRRSLAAAGLAGLALVAGAGPAAADPAKPGEFSSTVTATEPAVDGYTIEVAGGDGFLDLQVDPGHTAIVYGYEQDGNPTEYLQFLEDGTVQQNMNSPATYLNESRFGTTAAPADLSPDDPPDWRTIASGGEYAWHDHRIHFMGTQEPDEWVRGSVVLDWSVPIQVDGTDVEVDGQLTWEQGTPSILWFGLIVVVAAAIAAAARLEQVRIAAAGLLAGGVAAVVVSAVEYTSIPPNAGRSVVGVLVPALAVVAAVVALVRSRTPVGAIAGLASVALLAGWALLRIGVLLNPVLPTHLPFAVDRLGTVLAIGAAIAGAIVVVLSGSLKLPELSDDEDD